MSVESPAAGVTPIAEATTLGVLALCGIAAQPAPASTAVTVSPERDYTAARAKHEQLYALLRGSGLVGV